MRSPFSSISLHFRPFFSIYCRHPKLCCVCSSAATRLHKHRRVRPPILGNGTCFGARFWLLYLGAIAHSEPRREALSTGSQGAINVARKSLTLVRVGPVTRLSPN